MILDFAHSSVLRCIRIEEDTYDRRIFQNENLEIKD